MTTIKRYANFLALIFMIAMLHGCSSTRGDKSPAGKEPSRKEGQLVFEITDVVVTKDAQYFQTGFDLSLNIYYEKRLPADGMSYVVVTCKMRNPSSSRLNFYGNYLSLIDRSGNTVSTTFDQSIYAGVKDAPENLWDASSSAAYVPAGSERERKVLLLVNDKNIAGSVILVRNSRFPIEPFIHAQ